MEADSGHFEVGAVALTVFEMMFSYTMMSFHVTRHGLNSRAAFQLCHKQWHDGLSP